MGLRPRPAQGNRPREDWRNQLSDSDQHTPRKPSTRVVEAGRRPEWTGAAVNPPVWRASTHLYTDAKDLAGGRPNADGHFYYGRRGAPTQWALAEALTELEPGAAGTVLYPSGVAAIANVLLAVLKPGDVLLVTDNAYEPTRNIALGMLKQYDIEARPFDPLDLTSFENAFCERTRAVMLESPGSLTMEVCDIPQLAAIAREKGAVSILDNTWASSLGFPALERGCDISIMSLTKHVGGHSDLMMGSASAGEEWYTKLRLASQYMGQVVSPDDAALALRGLRTMALRLEHSTQAALEIARWLQGRPEVAHVLCPMLDGAPGNALWQRDFTGGCGLFSIVLKGRSVSQRARFLDALELFGLGYSWGGFESLAIPFDPARTRSEMAWPPASWDAEDRLGVRFSIGLEDVADLLSDIGQALDAMED
ncbi:cystathionine beta-lyase [Alteraurantiacibacter aquimixticola]|uniref:Cystathionine beta-lyase n=1 Tax=Alteraurantiacibacter aquimixticola TaxID=2489173 RepID=A0A4T3F2G9_9SPHN|nr:cystathionine beta-lyase [Alteraurantiacibacter aquimixticola]TIX51396.1 cystathionine beta-lyase [Alteraurantiacibacter aquimixticola]